MTAHWPAPFLVLVALVAVPYLARSAKRAFGPQAEVALLEASAANAEKVRHLQKLERYRVYCIVVGLAPLVPLYFIRPPAAAWLVIALVAIVFAGLAGVALTSFAIGWNIGAPSPRL